MDRNELRWWLTNILIALWVIALWVIVLMVLLTGTRHAHAHEIYTGLAAKGQLCCGDDDCEPTHFRERGEHYEFYTREGHWIEIPQDRIAFLPVPGDQLKMKDGSDDPDLKHRAHLCYATPHDNVSYSPEFKANKFFSGEGQTIIFYCAFISPGAI